MFLLAILMVFKTQTAYNQYWTATNAYYQVYNGLRALARRGCVLGKGDGKEIQLQRLCRYEVLLMRVTRKYLATSGVTGGYCDPAFLTETDKLVRELCSEREYGLLVNRPDKNQPDIVFHWILALIKALGIDNPPTLGLLAQIEKDLEDMEMIDKEQFPFPYYQLVKVLMIAFLTLLPISLTASCGYFTPVVELAAAFGLFGLDEVAECLETPFGNDVNDYDLGDIAKELEQYCVHTLQEYEHLPVFDDPTAVDHVWLKRKSMPRLPSGLKSDALDNDEQRVSAEEEEAPMTMDETPREAI
jgi:putative membrane protein